MLLNLGKEYELTPVNFGMNSSITCTATVDPVLRLGSHALRLNLNRIMGIEVEINGIRLNKTLFESCKWGS